MDKKKERVFEIFDELIDTDASNGQSFLKYINRELPSLRKRCIRTFGSMKAALTEYGFILESEEELELPKLFDFLCGCFEVAEDGRIRVDFEQFLDKSNELTALGYVVNRTKIIKQMEEALELDRIEAFIRKYNERACEILDSTGKKYPENQINTIIEKYYKVRKNVYKTYKVNPFMITSASFVRLRELMKLGSEFEDIVYEVLAEISNGVDRYFILEDCRPDFVIGEKWYDAKLARKTALDTRSSTIDKYTKHTDYLTIIYAIDDTTATDSRANFVHITEYYPYISVELQRKIDAFIRKATEVKFGGGCD